MSTIFRPGKPGKKLPIILHQPPDYAIPSVKYPFYVAMHARNNDPLTRVHIHNGLELTTVCEGRGQLYYDGTYYDLQPDDCCFVDAMKPHYVGTVGTARYSQIFAHFSIEALLSVPPPDVSIELLRIFHGPENYKRPVIANQKQIRKLLSSSMDGFSSPWAFGKIDAWSTIIQTLLELARLVLSNNRPAVSSDEKRNPQKLSGALEFIHAHFTEQIPIETIAENSCTSAPHLFHLFNKYLHCSPIEYRNRLRNKYAFELLATSNKKIETIAFECGYNSKSAFFLSFKKFSGQSPDKVRRS